MAMRNLWEMYAVGQGTTQNHAEAKRWRELGYKEGGVSLGAPGNIGK
jgi:TPR repeat protein